MLLLILVGAVAGAAAVAVLTQDDETATTESSPADEHAVSEASNEEELPADEEESPEVATAEAASDTTCRVESDPPGASVWAGGERICASTPCDASRCEEELELRRAGFVSATVHPEDGHALATLEPIRRRGRSRPRGMRGHTAQTTTTASVMETTPPPVMTAPEPPAMMTASSMMRRGPRPQDLPPL